MLLNRRRSVDIEERVGLAMVACGQAVFVSNALRKDKSGVPIRDGGCNQGDPRRFTHGFRGGRQVVEEALDGILLVSAAEQGAGIAARVCASTSR